MLLSSWLKTWQRLTPSGRKYSPRRRRPNYGPPIEALECRVLLTAYNAATAVQLVADINAANQSGGTNTITLTAPATSPYDLTNALPVISGGIAAGGTKKHPVSAVPADNLTIIGNGDIIERSTAAGTPAFRLFDVAPGASLTLQDMTLQNGLAIGSGAAAEGGAIYNQGTLVLSQVLIQSNTAEGYAGATGSDAAGGGIWSNGVLTLENGTVLINNLALGGQSLSSGNGGNASGGAIFIAGGTASMFMGTTFNINTAQGGAASEELSSWGGSAYGGAVYIASGKVTLSGDTLGDAPGGPNSGLENAAFGGHDLEGGRYGNADGGALYAAGGTVTLTNDSVINNEADGYDSLVGSYTGGIVIGSGATAYLDLLTVSGTYGNAVYSEASASYEPGGPQILGTYNLL